MPADHDQSAECSHISRLTNELAVCFDPCVRCERQFCANADTPRRPRAVSSAQEGGCHRPHQTPVSSGGIGADFHYLPSPSFGIFERSRMTSSVQLLQGPLDSPRRQHDNDPRGSNSPLRGKSFPPASVRLEFGPEGHMITHASTNPTSRRWSKSSFMSRRTVAASTSN